MVQKGENEIPHQNEKKNSYNVNTIDIEDDSYFTSSSFFLESPRKKNTFVSLFSFLYVSSYPLSIFETRRTRNPGKNIVLSGCVLTAPPPQTFFFPPTHPRIPFFPFIRTCINGAARARVQKVQYTQEPTLHSTFILLPFSSPRLPYGRRRRFFLVCQPFEEQQRPLNITTMPSGFEILNLKKNT